MTARFGKTHAMLLGALVLAGHVPAMEAVPSTSTLLEKMENAKVDGDPSLMTKGDKLFHTSCSQCHDAERATSKHKSYDEWLFTVHRMASKPGANVPESAVEPIAEYLASLNPAEMNEAPPADTPSMGEVLAASSVSMNGTVYVLWRHGTDSVENEGFFPDVWVGGEWRPEDSPFSAQVMACTTCHDDGSGGMNLELVEGNFRADLIHLMTGERAEERNSNVKLEAKAGRFTVPFGAYSGMSHPGVYRTLTNPLMYNMGRRVGSIYTLGYYAPVLPMPYSDEGFDLHLGTPLPFGCFAKLDGYAVNGLQGVGDFKDSRSWRDNNSNAALGGRVALGSSWITVGGSYATGELQDTGDPKRNYTMAGGDVSLHYLDFLRFYYEYAERVEDSTPTVESRISGQVAELEGKIWCKPKITMLVRYDEVENPITYGGGATIQRITWGPNVTLPGGSLVIINHEQWKLDPPLNQEDIVGVRWVASF